MTQPSSPGLSPDVLGGSPEAFVQTALIAGGIGLWEWHLATGDMVLSPHLETLLGYPPRGFDGASQTFLHRLLPADRVRVEAAVGAVAANGNETDSSSASSTWAASGAGSTPRAGCSAMPSARRSVSSAPCRKFRQRW